MRRRFREVEREIRETEESLEKLRFRRCKLFHILEEERIAKAMAEASDLPDKIDLEDTNSEILRETAKDLEELLKD